MVMTTKKQSIKLIPIDYGLSNCTMVYPTAFRLKNDISKRLGSWPEVWIFKEFCNLTRWPTNRDFSLGVALNRETVEPSGIWRLEVATVKTTRDCMMPYHRHFRLFLQITFSFDSFALVHPWERLWVRVQKPFKRFFWILPWRDE